MAGRLVSHRSVSDALSQLYGESLARGGALESGGAAEEAAAFSDAEVRAYLTDALAALEAEERDAGVMATAQHQLASLLQSHLADNPDDIQVLEEEAAGGGLEVKFDKG